MKRLVFALLSILLLTGCSSSFAQKGAAGKALGVSAPSALATPTATAVVDSTCPDRLANEIASTIPNGGYNCLRDDLQFALKAQYGVVDDASFMIWINDGSTTPFDLLKAIPPADMGLGPDDFFYHFSPVDERGTPGYYTNGFMWDITLDPATGKIAKIQRQ